MIDEFPKRKNQKKLERAKYLHIFVLMPFNTHLFHYASYM